ncbi:indolepyruvate ferredoxin oxidoreductase subunit alpha [Archaeoglobus profundus]|uniref:Indolepyruvate oxidoreductase subunit IorA n=1 Tax=Archaeoglobus profundus (strain DSM 5631 / JCM 9629 / NBRC 100127 / Av18) TaxID=572546 RepID=D2RGQ0_ARCPA|nr:indolepyruvate ferredoxin oxidoreductase subunit alpha [Archaeoglobus profundus]ADB57475.1 indolepyruvate ferredoxin oxidoreductase, alpha subunit [Archaeoglobus profundus DSM 5631]
MHVLGSEGEKAFLLGNEAIARGALEAGVDVFACYPGTPSSEIGDTLAKVSKLLKDFMHVEYSTNEKVAFEVAMGASLAGKRGMCAMKHVGVNVASDALFSFAYIGAVGGFVLVTADDPFMHSSQNEQDNRWYGLSAKVPVFEAHSVQELKDLTKECFEISEKFGLPVILRTYTRLSHARGIVRLGKIPEKKLEKVEWVAKPEKFVVLPSNARKLKLELEKKLKNLQDFLERWERNWVEDGDSRLGIIACGLSYSYVKDALKRLNLNLPILKLSSMHPLPMKKIEDFVTSVERVLVVEEVDPIVEIFVKTLTKNVYGKLTGHLPMHYEYSIPIVEKAIAKLLNIPTRLDYDRIVERAREISKIAPPRPPVLCPGCPHSPVFYVLRKIANEVKCALPSDIGCYTLGYNPPYRAVEVCVCMGASVGVSNGLSWVIKDKIIATIGDSTFFHAGIPALINAVYNGAKFVLVVLDNMTTGMTGHQPHPGIGLKADGSVGKAIKIEEVAKACGVEFVEVVNSYSVRNVEDAVRRALDHDSVAVVVAKQLCSIVRMRELRRKGVKLLPFEILQNKCNNCGECYRVFSCPAIYLDGEKPQIDPALCTSCGVCARICPERAIKVKKS